MSYNLEQSNSGYGSLTAAGLAITTNKAKFKTTNTLAFLIDGVFKSKAATDNLVFSSGHTSLAASQACLFGVWIDASGNVTTNQGPIVAAGDPCPVPASNNGKALVGLIKVSCDSTGAFVPNTTNFDGTGVTTTYIDCSRMPGAAQ